MSHKAVQNGTIRHQQVTINILQRFRYITFATADMDAYKSSSNDNALKRHFTHIKLFFKITEIETLINITYIVRFLRSTDVSVFYY